MMKKLFCTIVFLLFVGLPQLVYAQCDDVANSSVWNQQIVDVAAYYDHGDYKEAIDIGRELLKFCDRSPTLNYYLAVSYQGLDDNIKALGYILKASDSTKYMATSQTNEKNIKRKLTELEMIVMGESTGNIKRKEDYKSLMWTGVGVMGTGLLLTIIGSVLVARDGDTITVGGAQNALLDNDILENVCLEEGGPDNHDETPETKKCKDNVNSYIHAYQQALSDGKITSNQKTESKANLAGYTLLGAGIFMTVGGVLLTGIYGYKYTHLDISDDMQLSFQVSPFNAGIGVTF